MAHLTIEAPARSTPKALRSIRRGLLSLLALSAVTTLTTSACSDATGSDGPGLRPGSYAVQFEISQATGIPEPLSGRHDFEFRVSAPADSPADVQLLSSMRRPPGEPAETGYLVLDPELLQISAEEWLIRFAYAEGGYQVSLRMLDNGNGGWAVVPGCFGRTVEGVTFLASSCRVDRL